MAPTDRVESAFYTGTGDGYRCGLCPHLCRIPFGKRGRCGSRYADDDFLSACTYGRVTALCIDPIEKKPLNHYRPGSLCLSVGGAGCNMTCLHCQNHSISSVSSGIGRSSYRGPQEIVDICRSEGMDTLAFTYNEPTIWFEYIRDIHALAPDVRIVLVTNGLVCEEPMRELCGMADAMNIDVKGFTGDFYRKVCGAELRDVMASCETAFSMGVHVELTYLVIPGYNDTEEEVRGFAEWVAGSLSPDVPVHFNRFHPDNRMTDVPPTPVGTVLRCREIAMESGLMYVYAGNIMSGEGSDTVCPECGSVAVRRTGYDIDTSGLEGSRCAVCGHELNIRT